MDKFLPPPNGSPEEIQAWNDMMDTMVTFIKASTHLMNTISTKVRSSSSKVPATLKTRKEIDKFKDCEPECETCKPKPPCGICGKEKPGKVPSRAASLSNKEQPQIPDSPAPVGEEAAPPSAPENAEDAPQPAAEEIPPADAAEETVPATEDTPNADEETPPDVPAAAEKRSSSTAAAAPTKTASAIKDASGCICLELRAKKLKDAKANKSGSCCCSKKKKNQQKAAETIQEESAAAADDDDDGESSPEEEDAEYICRCGPTDGNVDFMMKDMVEKLANAQKEISSLQEEMARLQRMDASKRIGPNGGPNPALLYKEIMRNSETAYHQSSEPMCLPCNPANSANYGGRSMRRAAPPPSTRNPIPAIRSAQYYHQTSPTAANCLPCRRPGCESSASAPMSMMASSNYSRNLPLEYPDSPDPQQQYWSPSPIMPQSNNRQMIVCPILKNQSPNNTTNSLKRQIICGPPNMQQQSRTAPSSLSDCKAKCMR